MRPSFKRKRIKYKILNEELFKSLKSFNHLSISLLSPHIRESKTSLDSGFYSVDFGFPMPYYGFQSPGFRILLQTFTGFRVPQDKTSRIGNPESLTWGDQSLRFLFLLPLSSICSPDSTYVCLAQYHKIFILFVQRLSSVLFLFVSTERPRALFAAEAHTYRKWKPIHARKFGYDVGVHPVSVHTDSEGRVKNLSR